MNIQLVKLSIKSMWRRRKQVLSTCIMALIVIMIITFTVLFRDNMYRMQDRINREDFGDWFVMQSIGTKVNPVLEDHMYLGDAGIAKVAIDVYDKDYDEVDGVLGCYDEKFKEIGNIKLKEGKLPTKENEIAIEYNTLVKMGYMPVVGTEVTINYIKGYGDNEEELKRKYILSGVIENISSVWDHGEKLPSVIVTEKEYEFYEVTEYHVYIYPLVDVIDGDYKEIFTGMESQSDKIIHYNSYVFDYKPWGSEKVYNYIYVAVMIVGVAILSYKILDYQNTRKEFNARMRKIGATRFQLNAIRIFENIFMLVVFGILGIAIAIWLGSFVAQKVEDYIGISFYGMGEQVYIRGGIGIIAGIVVGEIANILAKFSEKKGERQRIYKAIKEKWYISVKNHIYQIHSRFVKRSGIIAAIGVRIFYLCILFVIISSCVNVYTAQKAAKENEGIFDAAGNKTAVSQSKKYGVDIMCRLTQEEWEEVHRRYDEEKRNDLMPLYEPYQILPPSYDEYLKIINSDDEKLFLLPWQVIAGECKIGINNLYTGFGDEFVTRIKELPGVEKIQMSCYETQRDWSWQGCSVEKMALRTLNSQYNVYEEVKYLFATEYINSTEVLYEKLKKYIEPEYYDYEAFKNGKQVVIFVDKNADGYYDDTINPGEEIRYKYYDYEDIIEDTIGRYHDDDEKTYFVDVDKNVYEYWFGTNVALQVAGVVYLDENVKKDLEGIVSEFGFYTAVASMDLAYELNKNDLKLYKESVKEEYQVEGFGEMKHNKISLNYDTDSVIYATENKVNSYFENEGAQYKNYSEQKAIYRTQLINALLQNGITILLCVVVSLSVSIILTHNRFHNRKKELQLFRQIGMEQNKLLRICMIEVLRESVWCIITAPLVLLLQYISYKLKFRKL